MKTLQPSPQKGFTFVEVLVAVFIITVGVWGAIWVVLQNRNVETGTQARLQGIYLAQEGLELVRNLRDKNFFEVNNQTCFGAACWRTAVVDLTVCGPPTGCELQYDSGTLVPYADQTLSIDANGLYSYDPGEETPYKRRVTLMQTEAEGGLPGNLDKLEIVSEVTWNNNNKTEIREDLYNWFEPTPILLAYWNFDDGGSQTVADTSGSIPAADGTLGVNSSIDVDDPVLLVANVAPLNFANASALGFDGLATYVDIDSTDNIKNLDVLSFSAWIYPTADGDREIIVKGDSLRELRIKPPLRLRGCVDILTGPIACSESVDGSLALGSWNHVALTYDNTVERKTHLYINGSEVSYALQVQATGAIAQDNNTPVNIGRRPDGIQYFEGRIDDVRIYKGVLTLAQIEALFNGDELVL